MGISFIAGPLIGGFLTDHVGWRSVFTVNLPIGAAALVVVATVLPASIGRSEQRDTPLDLAGIALLTVAVGLLLVGLSERTHADALGALPGWLEVRTGGLIVAGLLVAAAFVAVERRAAAPMIPLRLRHRPPQSARSCSPARPAMFGLFAGVLLLPRYFQTVRDVSATHSGLLIYPLLLGLLVSVNVAGAAIVRRLEFRGADARRARDRGAGRARLRDVRRRHARLADADLHGAARLRRSGRRCQALQIALTRTVAPARRSARRSAR